MATPETDEAAAPSLFQEAPPISDPGPGPRPEPPALELVLNIPAARVDVIEGGIRTRSFAVAVGARDFATPVGEYRIGEAIWNPWWHPPDSDWARDEKPQPPGPGNPMGRVKLHFFELYFLHGSPSTASIGQAASHGCVRLRNADAIALARIVHGHGSPGLSSLVLDSLEADIRKTRTIRLERPVPLRSVYTIAEVRDGRLEVHPDFYRREPDIRARVLEALGSASCVATAADSATVTDLLRPARRQTISMELERLECREAP